MPVNIPRLVYFENFMADSAVKILSGREDLDPLAVFSERFETVVEHPLEGQHDWRHRVESVHVVEQRIGGGLVGHEPVLIHDRCAPEPRQQRQLEHVLHVS